jgi:hypothetical protein
MYVSEDPCLTRKDGAWILDPTWREDGNWMKGRVNLNRELLLHCHTDRGDISAC